MSLILKGINLPEEGTLTFRITRYGKAYEITDNNYYIKGTEIEAIQIPKDHGNIIDESKAVVTETIDGYYEITAPTILESEGTNEYHIERD